MTVIGPGTRVKCVYRGIWSNKAEWDGIEYTGPSFGTVWTVSEVIHPGFVTGAFFRLAEWTVNQSFHEDSFRPLDGDAELAILRSIALNPRGYVELPSREPAEAQS